MSTRQKFLAALWAAFGLFWAFAAVKTAINPLLVEPHFLLNRGAEPQDGPPVILILQIALVALCGLVVLRVIWSPHAGSHRPRH
jgi:hypothetical protein